MTMRPARWTWFLAAAVALGNASPVLAMDGHLDQANAMVASGTPIRKLGRGLANVATGALELPVTMSTIGNEEGPVGGLFLGLLQGVGRAIARTAVGVLEIVTFPMPLEQVGYGPIVEPEFLFHP